MIAGGRPYPAENKAMITRRTLFKILAAPFALPLLKRLPASEPPKPARRHGYSRQYGAVRERADCKWEPDDANLFYRADGLLSNPYQPYGVFYADGTPVEKDGNGNLVIDTRRAADATHKRWG